MEIGCIVALAAVYFSFEYTTQEVRTTALEEAGTVVEIEDLIPITFETPPPPPALPQIVLSDILDIVDDDIEVNDDQILLLDDDFDAAIQIIDCIEVIEEDVEEESIPFILVEEKPKFNGKDANEFSRWVNQRLDYPQVCIENGVEGRVVLEFTIKADGALADIKVLRGVDQALDNEAVRVVGSSPRWAPGRQRDRAVSVTYTFPVIFRLR